MISLPSSLHAFGIAIYLPKSLRDCVIVPVPKSGKDPSCSENYRPITLASTLSKVVEHIILQKYGYLLSSNKLGEAKAIFTRIIPAG